MKVGSVEVDSSDRAAVHAAFNALYVHVTDEMNAVWSQIGPTEPSAPIYHYTTAAGLHGILEDRAIFLTDAFYLSDKTELRYGRDLVSEVLAQFTTAASGEVERFLREKVGDFDPFTGVLQATFYVASFCERSDLLSQWRMYGGGGAGFALGFPADTFNHADRFARSATLSPNLHRIEYDRDTQRQVVTHVVKRCTEILSGDMAAALNTHERKVLSAGHFALLMLQLAGLVSTFKYPMFDEEREWRLTLSRLRDEEEGLVKFRPAGKDLVPFIPCPLGLKETGRLPLCEIVVSPANEPALQTRTVTKLLREKKYPEGSVKIVEPSLPLEFR